MSKKKDIKVSLPMNMSNLTMSPTKVIQATSVNPTMVPTKMIGVTRATRFHGMAGDKKASTTSPKLTKALI